MSKTESTHPTLTRPGFWRCTDGVTTCGVTFQLVGEEEGYSRPYVILSGWLASGPRRGDGDNFIVPADEFFALFGLDFSTAKPAQPNPPAAP